jgi:hypothetical protein
LNHLRRQSIEAAADIFVLRASVFYSRHSTWHSSTSAALCGTISQTETLASAKIKTENGMLVELRERVGRRDRLLFTCAKVLTLIILMTTVSCSTPGPEMPQPRAGIVERAQPKPTASPKVATVNAPKAKKASTPPRLGAQREQQLFQEFQEFLEWRKRQNDQP